MQLKYHIVTIEELVPENHFLRKLEKSLGLSFVKAADLVRGHLCHSEMGV